MTAKSEEWDKMIGRNKVVRDNDQALVNEEPVAAKSGKGGLI